MDRIINIDRYYTCMENMLKRYDRCTRLDAFNAATQEEYYEWREKTRALLIKLTGIDRIDRCSLKGEIVERVVLDDGMTREKLLLSVEEDVYMPVYILIPKCADKYTECYIAPAGHQGAGKYSVAGRYDIPAVADMIDYYSYDYGMQLAKRGHVVFCPDCRGFGERREADLQNNDEKSFLNSTCYQLSHMAEPLGLTVIGLLTWDLMRLVDYIVDSDRFCSDNISCLGFSGGGMQALWLAALDDRIKNVIISGYMYGYRDSLLRLNGNCSCNYVPHLYEHVDMGDIGALIAPSNIIIQTCMEDHLNGERGVINASEQVDIIRRAYRVLGQEDRVLHDICDGPHHWESSRLDYYIEFIKNTH